MKKVLTLMLAAALVAVAAACAKKPEVTPEVKEEETAPVEEETVPETEETADPEENGEEEAVETPAVMTYADYMAAELQDHVVVETYVQAKQSYYAEQGTASIYAQDEDGAIFLYDAVVSADDYEKLVPGTKIRVDGYKGEWSGEVEITDATVEIIEGDGFIAEPLDVTGLLDSDELIAHQNEFVSFKGMTVEASDDGGAAFLYKWDGSGSEGDDLYFKVSKDGKIYSFTVESYLCDASTDVYQAVKALAVGDVIDLEGFLYWYEGANPHITAVAAAE